MAPAIREYVNMQQRLKEVRAERRKTGRKSVIDIDQCLRLRLHDNVQSVCLPHLVGAPHHAHVVGALLPGVADPRLLVQDGVVEGVGLLLEIKQLK